MSQVFWNGYKKSIRILNITWWSSHMKWFLDFLERRGRKRIVLDRQSNEPYLERYYVFLRDRERFPFNIFLHKFLKSDPDDLHDHPWPYATLILKGGYWEWLPQFDSQGRRITELAVWRGRGHFRISPARSFHRIELDPAVECWTLFMPGRKVRDWGFLVQGQWVQWQQYLQERKTR
jgi:hypothetical protein